MPLGTTQHCTIKFTVNNYYSLISIILSVEIKKDKTVFLVKLLSAFSKNVIVLGMKIFYSASTPLNLMKTVTKLLLQLRQMQKEKIFFQAKLLSYGPRFWANLWAMDIFEIFSIIDKKIKIDMNIPFLSYHDGTYRLAFTCLKSTLERVEKCVKSVQS